MQHCDQVAFTIGGRSFPAGTVGVIDLRKYLPSELGQIDGTLALDVFADQAFTLSYSGRFLRVLGDGELAERRKGLQAMPVHIVRDAEGLALTVNLPVKTPAGEAWFEVDSGNTSSLVLVSKVIAPFLGLTAGEKEPIAVHLTLPTKTNFKIKKLDL